MEQWRPIELAYVPTIEEFKELTRELLREGVTNSEVMRNNVRRSKQLIIQETSGNWNDSPSGKFVNNHAHALARMVIDREIETIDEKQYRLVEPKITQEPLRNAAIEVKAETIAETSRLLSDRVDADLQSIAPSSIARVVLNQVTKDLENALEGMLEERKIKFRYRAAWLAQQFVEERLLTNQLSCDRCNFDPQLLPDLKHLKPRSLFDVHHKDPLAEGRRYTSCADFSLLCPTCHRIEHALLAANHKIM